MPSSAVELRLHRTGIDAELTLPIGELAMGWEKPLPLDSVKTVQKYGAEIEEYVHTHVHPSAPDGRPWTVTVRGVTPLNEQEPDVRVALTMTPPSGAPVDRLTFHYDVIFHHLITHTAVVTLASDWHSGLLGEEPVILGTMRDTRAELAIDRSGGSWFQGFAAMFRLGARHIAEGTDHLLFLLALILPAPLVAANGKWGGYAGWKTAFRRIVKVVTAFTLGHSITLVFGGAGLGAPPRRPRRVGHCPVDPCLSRSRLGPSLPGPGSLDRRRLRAGARPGVRGDAGQIRIGPVDDGFERAGL